MDDVGFLRKLLELPSPSGSEGAVGDFLVDHMTDLGFDAWKDEVGNAIGVVGNPSSRRHIVLLGHMDTVPGDIRVELRGERLYGRGAVDAKGPLAVFVLAAAKVAPCLEDARITVIGAVEEEGSGKGAHHLAHTMPAPWCAIIGEPSGWQGITLGYKGMLNLRYRLVQPGGHTAGQFPGPAEKGVAFWNQTITYAEKWNHGRAGHFDTLDAALRDFRTFSDGLNDGVEMSIIVRVPPNANVSELRHKMDEWRNGSGASLEVVGSDKPFRSEKNTPPVRALLRGIRSRGGRPVFKLKTGTSDMNVVGPAWGCPIVAYGPGDSSLDHTNEEHVTIGEFRRSVSVLSHALRSLPTTRMAAASNVLGANQIPSLSPGAER
jgi:LysW-gamma-L-lysine carboxypeptidase